MVLLYKQMVVVTTHRKAGCRFVSSWPFDFYLAFLCLDVIGPFPPVMFCF